MADPSTPQSSLADPKWLPLFRVLTVLMAIVVVGDCYNLYYAISHGNSWMESGSRLVIAVCVFAAMMQRGRLLNS